MPISTPSALKTTCPTGTAWPGAAVATVAVKVTGRPWREGVREVVTATVVPLSFTR